MRANSIRSYLFVSAMICIENPTLPCTFQASVVRGSVIQVYSDSQAGYSRIQKLTAHPVKHSFEFKSNAAVDRWFSFLLVDKLGYLHLRHLRMMQYFVLFIKDI